ncbi:MAG: DUF1624 domain-containing protein [Coprobacillus sp.]|nr:DUF1624 domain-containing protein [Coprobacillus sp.]
MSDSTLILEEPVDRKPKVKAFDKRVHEIDFLRGICILLVVFDHIMYDLYAYKSMDFATWYWHWTAREVFREFVLFVFCFLSGISTTFSRNNWRRACELLLIMGLILFVTNIGTAWGIFGNISIEFNVIGVLGVSTLLYAFFEKKSWRALLGVLLICVLFTNIALPMLYDAFGGYGGAYVPFLWANKNYGDYMPLFPYIIWFFAGAIFARFYYQNKQSLLKHKFFWERPICFIGRHTLIIYICHQIILTPLFYFI